ncbi:uncharacterized protein EI90DRAFT_41219 [Cantharellus anzutake]|uniref:uncharacterized protein n=1 Tax=Cantharellus anzutake TaxID=1750568 RepID=UPI001908908C|nr:uncharacterized protein EI90DRAFT_41219 [Cantharellus anzutake]KAF8344058.1 hypothetical protein EI90DRAFT_41219 [Cantharellus anzutake]
MVQEVFSDGKGQYKAYLIDFDFAIEAGAREPGFSPTHRTVITPFLALELTTESEHRPRALYRHDLESFFWTYWWIAIYYGGDFRRPLKRRRLSSSRRKDDFVDWYVGTFGAIRRRKAAFLDDPYSIHLSPGMESLHPNIQKLRELFNDANDCLRRQRRNPRPDFDQETIDGLITYEGIRALL